MLMIATFSDGGNAAGSDGTTQIFVDDNSSNPLPGAATAGEPDVSFTGIPPITGGGMQFLDATPGATNSSQTATTNGSVTQGQNSYVELTNGVNVSNGVFSVNQQPGATLVLDGNSLIDNGGTLTATSSNDQGTLAINGTLALGPTGSNLLDLNGEQVTGQGAIIQSGKNDTTRVDQVNGVQFQIDNGALVVADAPLFNGTIGPAPGDPSTQAIGSSGLVAVLGAALQTAAASFDAGDGILSLFTSGGQSLGGLRFSGDVSGLTVNVTTGLSTNYLAITDHPGGGGGSIPITFT
jgi:hypothetical protein